MFYSHYYFNCVPHIWIGCIFIFIQLTVFLVFLETFSLTHKLLCSCCLISQCLEILLLFFCYLFLVWFSDGQRMHSIKFQFLKFIDTCFMAQNMVYLGRCSLGTWKMCILLLLSAVFYIYIYIYVYGWWQC